MRITVEDLQYIEKAVGGKGVNAFVGFEHGEIFLQVDCKDMHYREVVTKLISEKEQKEFFIGRFAYYASQYINAYNV